MIKHATLVSYPSSRGWLPRKACRLLEDNTGCLKVQACPPQFQTRAIQARVLGRDGMARVNNPIHTYIHTYIHTSTLGVDRVVSGHHVYHRFIEHPFLWWPNG